MLSRRGLTGEQRHLLHNLKHKRKAAYKKYMNHICMNFRIEENREILEIVHQDSHAADNAYAFACQIFGIKGFRFVVWPKHLDHYFQ